jgi:hypothetical protein
VWPFSQFRTHQRYQAALESALQHFKKLHDSQNSKHWQIVPPSSTQPNHSRSQFSQSQPLNHHHHQFLNGLAPIDLSNVQVHRRKLDGSSVVRAISDLSIDPTRVDIDHFKAVLQTAEVRGIWDQLVDKAAVIQVIDPQTRIIKTDFRLGWPAKLSLGFSFIQNSLRDISLASFWLGFLRCYTRICKLSGTQVIPVLLTFLPLFSSPFFV